MKNTYFRTCIMARYTQKRGKWERDTLGPGVLREN